MDTAKLAEGIEDFCARVAGALDDLKFEQRRKLVELLIDCVIVGDGMVEIRYVVPTSSKGEEVPFCHLQSNYPRDAQRAFIQVVVVRGQDTQPGLAQRQRP
jgi:site-specific DNA recombinase